jgi:mono/diheme cytochrome c family protein
VEPEAVRPLSLCLAAAFVSLIVASPIAVSRANDSTIDASLVKAGAYLATAANCVSCHSRPGSAPFAGGVAFETQFGIVYSTNITPDAETGIGRWTEEQFRSATREGLRPNGDHLYPVFPYTAFTKLSDADVKALFAYLRTVPPVRQSAPANDLSFPFSQRWLLGAWKSFYFTEERYAPDLAKSAEWNRGAYLVEGLGHCGACHSPRNFLGAERASSGLAGGTYLDKVPGGQIRPWSAVNLTPTPDGLGPWSVDEIVSYLKAGLNSYATSFGPMNKVIMNSTRHLADADVRAIAVYLKGLPAREQGGSAKPDIAVQSEGESLYGIHCGTCHLPTGKGATDTGPALVGNPVVQAADPASLINVILYGPELPDPPPPMQRQHMEAYADKLTDEEVAALATYMRSAWGNRGGSVSADEVVTQR